MASKTEGQTLILGDRSFKLRKPKIGHIKQVVDALDAMRGKDGGELIDASVDLLIAGLQSANPGMTIKDLDEVETDLIEINAAVDKVLVIAGLRTAVAEPGEVMPQPAAR